PDPRKLNPDISENLSRLILVCMEKDRERRYQKAGELLADLKNIEEGFPLGTKIKPRRETFATALIRKKLFIPALIVALAIIALVIWRLLPKAPRRPSIAVLPFVDLSPQKDQEYFCDGLTGEIIAKLSTLKGIKVISRTSTMRYKETDKDIKRIGQELDVAKVLEGTILKEADNIRVIVSLVDVEDRSQIWAETYDQKLDQVFAIQSQVSENIAQALERELSNEEIERLQRRPTENMEAYNLCLLGQYYWKKWTVEGAEKARDYYQESIRKDPEYADAYVGLARIYYQLGSEMGALSPKEASPLAKKAVERALEIDETLGEAHTTLGFIELYFNWDWQRAEVEFKRGIELSPSSAVAHDDYSLLLAVVGRLGEAIVEAKRSLELDPLLIIANSDLGAWYHASRQYDKSIQQLKKTTELDPNFLFALWNLGTTYLMKEMFQEAMATQEKAVVLSEGAPIYKSNLGMIYAKAGKKKEAQEILDELKQISKRRYVPATLIADIYIGLGKNDLALEWLEKAYEQRDIYLIWLKVKPRYDSLRANPRFKTLLKKMDLH
nr:tetratricopeptide repeat protein [bacterium]